MQQLLACAECQEQQRVQPARCERLFFTVPAEALVRAAKSKWQRASTLHMLVAEDTLQMSPHVCSASGVYGHVLQVVASLHRKPRANFAKVFVCATLSNTKLHSVDHLADVLAS